MFSLTTIAEHLGIKETAILKIETWAHVLFVMFAHGAGKKARFVSKKITATPQPIDLPSPMLADHTLDGGNPTKLAQLTFPKLVLPKYDGIRVHTNGGKLYTRTGNLIENQWLQQQLQHLPSGLEGEIVVDNSFCATTSHVRAYDKTGFSYKFYLFDNSTVPSGYFQRLLSLDKFANGNNILVAEWQIIRTLEELETAEFTYTFQGYEGIIIRDPESFYTPGRSSFTSQSYLSFKRAATTEGKVIGYKRKSEAGQPTDKLGSLILELNGVTFSCGSGLDNRTRAYWWQHRDQLIGKTVEFKYQPSEQVKPRFPVFLRFR